MEPAVPVELDELRVYYDGLMAAEDKYEAAFFSAYE